MNVKERIGALFIPLLMLGSCVSDDDSYTQGVWERRADLDGPARASACSFTIGNKGYLFGGYGYKSSKLRDLWMYNMEDDYWVQCASMPEEGMERYDAVAFVINGKGYITTGGVYKTSTFLKDTWEYDPQTDTWTRKDDFPGAARYGAMGFAINGYGYVGCGHDGDNYLKDIYRFNPTAPAGSQWEIVNGYGGTKRIYATTFVMNNVAYLCCGSNNGTNVYDFWKFDGTTWTQLRDIANTSDLEYDDDYNIVRSRAVSFVIDDKAYIVGGNSSENSGTNYSDYWIYDPSTDLWSGEGDYEYTSFGGSSRTRCAAFSTGTRGFVVAGDNGSGNVCDDIWELLPYELED